MKYQVSRPRLDDVCVFWGNKEAPTAAAAASKRGYVQHSSKSNAAVVVNSNIIFKHPAHPGLHSRDE